MARLAFTTTAAAFALAMGAAVATSCGGSKSGNGFGDDGGNGGDDSGMRLGDGANGDDTIGFGDDGSGGDGGGCNLHCSSDLHNVLDCNNKVVTACPPDQGCSGNGCAAACDSAKANKSSIGCEYYSVDPDIIIDGLGACFAAFIANTWTSPVTITADLGGMPLSVASAARIPTGTGQSLTYQPLMNGQVQPGQVAIVFLNRFGNSGGGLFNFNCPTGVTPATTATDGAVHGTAIGKAFHIKTDRPVVAYDIFPFGGGQSAATSATLLIPTSAWDKNYVAVNAYAKDVAAPQAQPFFEVVASVANTKVTISPTAAIVGGTGVPATGMGQPQNYVLTNPGDYVQFTQDAELTGSPILADQPVGVWGGATCLNIDVMDTACDSAHQEIFPVPTLGHEYVAVRYRDRFTGGNESTPYRLVGAVDGTNLTYEPGAPNGAPTTLASRQVSTFWTSAPFVVKSQDDKHPFYMSAHMTGADRVDMGNSGDARGDPEFVNILPPQEFLASYVFFTDPTYPETNLVVVRTKGKSGFADVNLDCAGNLTGWLPVGNGGNYEYTRVDLATGNFGPGVNGCNNGRHEIHSDNPFGLTVWGWGTAATGAGFGSGVYSQYVSYAYPAGASVQPINTVVVPPTPK
jgi:hypothetical protein